MPNTLPAPKVSVIVPVCGGADLKSCLTGLQASTFRDVEVIVVDDGSCANAGDVAEKMGAALVTVNRPCRGAEARNLGAMAARGDILVFLHADVSVHADTLARLVDALETHPDVGAVFGCADVRPVPADVVSQYNNLLQYYVQQSAGKESSKFWTGCGAVRRALFEQTGGFKLGEKHVGLEDVEFARALGKAGQRILFIRAAQVSQRTRWSLLRMLKCYFQDRGLPESRYVLKHGAGPDDYNFLPSQRRCLALAFGLLVLAVLGVLYGPARLIAPVFGLALIVAGDHWKATLRLPEFVRFSAKWAVVFTTVIVCLSFQVWSLLAVAMLAAILSLDRDLFTFLALERGTLFAARVFPLHILQYWCRAVAVGVVAAAHYGKALIAWLKTAPKKKRRRLTQQRRLRHPAAADFPATP